MNRPDIEAMLARANAATEGPWTHDEVTHPSGNVERWVSIHLKSPGNKCALVFLDDVPREDRPTFEWTHNDINDKARQDIEFIAAARTDLPELAAYAIALEEQVVSYITASELTLKKASEEMNNRIEKLEKTDLGSLHKRLDQVMKENDDLRKRLKGMGVLGLGT